jgi:hypothetical protein
MPTYLFKDINTEEEQELFMSITERDKYLEDNPHITQLVHGAPSIGDPIRLGLRKPDDAFRDRLKDIKKHHSRGITKSSINTF